MAQPRFTVKATVAGISRYVDLAQEDVACPHCGSTGATPFHQTVVTRDPDRPIFLLHLPMLCSTRSCSLPFVAVYLGTSNFVYAGTVPRGKPRIKREKAIIRISPDFYEILEQATAADAFGLTLIAGAGFRKAIEYLVKDYVARDLRTQLHDQKARGDEAAAAVTQAQIDKLLSQQLGAIIALIPSNDLREVARRAAWLGNDETHYTRKWVSEDLESLKRVLSLLTSHIVNQRELATLLERMPE